MVAVVQFDLAPVGSPTAKTEYPNSSPGHVVSNHVDCLEHGPGLVRCALSRQEQVTNFKGILKPDGTRAQITVKASRITDGCNDCSSQTRVSNGAVRHIDRRAASCKLQLRTPSCDIAPDVNSISSAHMQYDVMVLPHRDGVLHAQRMVHGTSQPPQKAQGCTWAQGCACPQC